jgi:hypothetical protein
MEVAGGVMSWYLLANRFVPGGQVLAFEPRVQRSGRWMDQTERRTRCSSEIVLDPETQLCLEQVFPRFKTENCPTDSGMHAFDAFFLS